MRNLKIVSLLPSATEIIYALGAGHMLYGRSHECDFPMEALQIPVCSSTNISTEASSINIDREVKDMLGKALSLYTVDYELLKIIKPDLIITQDQCKVCAVSLMDVEKLLKEQIGKEVEILSLIPNSLEDILEDIRTIALALDLINEGEALIESLTERYELVQHKVKFVKIRPKVLCIEWLEPLMAAGNWTPELIEIAGGAAVLSQKNTHSPWITMEQIIEADPDFIIVAPCGFTIERTQKEMKVLTDLPQWNELKAVKENKVFIADGNAYFNRSGPRIIDSIEILAEILQVNQFHYGMEGEAWIWDSRIA